MLLTFTHYNEPKYDTCFIQFSKFSLQFRYSYRILKFLKFSRFFAIKNTGKIE